MYKIYELISIKRRITFSLKICFLAEMFAGMYKYNNVNRIGRVKERFGISIEKYVYG
jgi:hypothetical protein